MGVTYRAMRCRRFNEENNEEAGEHRTPRDAVKSGLRKDDTELFKQFQDNEGFHRRLSDTVFGMTYEGDAASRLAASSGGRGGTRT